MGDPAYDDTTNITIPSRGENKLVVTTYESHLYIEDDGRFRADLGSWERELIEKELANSDVVGWLRNVDRKSWSLEIPYRDGGAIRPMFPDLVVVRRDRQGWLFDILEPHDPSRNDNNAKAVGLAEFAEKHGRLFSRIQLIRKMTLAGVTDYFRLDLNRNDTRQKVLRVTDNNQLDRVFGEKAVRYM
jgi:type III restriction enzyme